MTDDPETTDPTSTHTNPSTDQSQHDHATTPPHASAPRSRTELRTHASRSDGPAKATKQTRKL
jgi:hypothetical protein